LISLIICSRSKSISPALQANIELTIGLPYQLVVIDNSANSYSIFEAYNIGVSKSTFPYLCFMHDDIAYHTQNWGQKVIDHFYNQQVGAIGIAGTPYAAAMPGSWWGGQMVNICLLKENPGDDPDIRKYPPTGAGTSEVVLLDGVWLCIRKSLFDKISFDAVNYKGYHFYDVDICMQIALAGYKIFCVFDIMIRHYTQGNNMNANWNDNALIFNQKWKSVLPRSSVKLNYAERCSAELKTLKEYIYNLIYNGHTNKVAHKIAIMRVLSFRKGYLYHGTPIQLVKYLVKYFIGTSKRLHFGRR